MHVIGKELKELLCLELIAVPHLSLCKAERSIRQEYIIRLHIIRLHVTGKEPQRLTYQAMVISPKLNLSMYTEEQSLRQEYTPQLAIPLGYHVTGQVPPRLTYTITKVITSMPGPLLSVHQMEYPLQMDTWELRHITGPELTESTCLVLL